MSLGWMITVALLTFSTTVAAIETGSVPRNIINGRVTDQYGRPVASARMIVGGQDVISQPDGSFVVEGVRLPYDVIHVGPPMVAYRGLTLSSPTLVVMLPNAEERWPVLLTGHVPVMRGERVSLYFNAPGVAWRTMAKDEAGDYKFEFRWPPDKQAASGTVLALREAWTNPEASVRVPEYKAIATRSVTLTPESTAVMDFAPADFEPARNFPIRGRVVRPENFQLQSISVLWEFGDKVVHLHGLSSSMRPLGDAFDFLVPFMESATYTYMVTVSAFASPPEGSPNNASVRGLRPPVENVEVILYSGPQLLEPQESAAGVDSTTHFAWTASPGPGIYELTVERWRLTGPRSGGHYCYWVYLADTNTTLEDLPVIGFDRPVGDRGLIPGEQYLWSVRKLHSVSSVDEAASRVMWDKNSWVSASSSILFTVLQPSR